LVYRLSGTSENGLVPLQFRPAMQKRHKNRLQYFQEQEYTTYKYVIPFIEAVKQVHADSKVLEIGCGEGGNLKPFLDRGCKCWGIDLNQNQINNAKKFFEEHPKSDRLTLICENIYNIKSLPRFDFIVMRDVIEHIPNQEKFMGFLKQFLAPGGVVFFGFPPWHMPFGGHQQVFKNKFLSKIPYTHLLPRFLYRFVMRLFGESDGMIKSRMDIRATGITIERFEKIVKKEKYKTEKRNFYFFNPNYEAKFGLKPRKQIRIIAGVPYLRNLFTTAMYYLLSFEPEIDTKKL
jgi:SAM-dependent methyltransferase